MPANGIVAESDSDAVSQSTLLIVDIDLADVARLRTEGQVATRRGLERAVPRLKSRFRRLLPP